MGLSVGYRMSICRRSLLDKTAIFTSNSCLENAENTCNIRDTKRKSTSTQNTIFACSVHPRTKCHSNSTSSIPLYLAFKRHLDSSSPELNVGQTERCPKLKTANPYFYSVFLSQTSIMKSLESLDHAYQYKVYLYNCMKPQSQEMC